MILVKQKNRIVSQPPAALGEDKSTAASTARRTRETTFQQYRRAPTLAIYALFFLGYALPSLAASPTDRPIWTGTSGEFRIAWTASDLRVSRQDNPSETRFSLRSLAKAAWKKMVAEAAGQRLERQITYRLLSVVGPYLSYEEADDCDCGGAHPSAVKRFRAIDLEKTRADNPVPVSLTDIFSDGDVFAALVSDSLVRSALHDADMPQPSSLAELLDALDYRAVSVGDCGYLFSKELLQNFAFYDLRDGKVAVRISLSHEAEVCRGQMVQLGLLLPIPEKLAGFLDAARRKSGGILMADTAKLFKDTRIGVTFSTAKQYSITK